MSRLYSKALAFIVVLLLASTGCERDDTLAIVHTDPVTDITATTALSGGSVDRQDGTPPQEWGICWSTEPGPTTADFRTTPFVNKNPSFVSSMEGLTPGTTYYVRAYSRNGAGTAYGEEQTFTTLPSTSLILLNDISFDAINSNFDAVYSVDNQIEMVENAGVCWNLSGSPTLQNNAQSGGPGAGVFSVVLPFSGDGVVAYARAFATTASGTMYSETVTFGVMKDADNNRYNLVKVGDRFWFRENLKSSHFSNGDPITFIGSGAGTEDAWKNVGAAAFSLAPASIPGDYGYLYNGFAATDPRNLCPSGWHVPGLSDINTLMVAVGQNAGGRALKEAGPVHWTNNVSATNSSRFTALPAGTRSEDGFFSGTSTVAQFWSVSPDPISPFYRTVRIQSDSDQLFFTPSNEKKGHSVRCVRD